jgi:arylsulfatase
MTKDIKLGIHGNPHIKTPVINKLGAQSIRFTNFYVSPVCAPTWLAFS